MPEAAVAGSRRRRRTPGLRREEVAELAGIGVDWYTRLEQGRTISPSTTTVDALAGALRLSEAEHMHLRALARNPDRAPFARESVPGSIQRLVQAFPHPAYVTGRRWDVLAWNEAAAELFTDFGRMPKDDRNILLYVLVDPDARELFGSSWADEAKRMIAIFRTTYDLWAGDPAFVCLLERVQKGCPEFSVWWDTHDIRGGTGTRKCLHHPRKGPLCFETATFQANDDPALKLAIYTPV